MDGAFLGYRLCVPSVGFNVRYVINLVSVGGQFSMLSLIFAISLVTKSSVFFMYFHMVLFKSRVIPNACINGS